MSKKVIKMLDEYKEAVDRRFNMHIAEINKIEKQIDLILKYIDAEITMNPPAKIEKKDVEQST